MGQAELLEAIDNALIDCTCSPSPVVRLHMGPQAACDWCAVQAAAKEAPSAERVAWMEACLAKHRCVGAPGCGGKRQCDSCGGLLGGLFVSPREQKLADEIARLKRERVTMVNDHALEIREVEMRAREGR